MMANDGHIAKDTLFGPERIQARAIDWDQGDRGLSSGRAATMLQSRRRIHGRNRNHASSNRNALAAREPSIHGPRTTASDTLDIALAASGCDSAKVLHKPRLLSDNGSSYIAGDLAEYLEDKGMKHFRGAPMHPQTQGKIERWHQTLKNRILLENYFFEGELEAAIAVFIDHYNNNRYHESIRNLTPGRRLFWPWRNHPG